MISSLTLLSLFIIAGTSKIPNNNHVALNNKIIGGTTKTPCSLSFLAYVEFQSVYECSGAIISPIYVLTAAHCTRGRAANKFTVGADSTNGKNGVNRKVQKIIQHPNYNSASKDYDIAILHLATAWQLGPTISAISLPAQGSPVNPLTRLLVAGYGRLSALGTNGPNPMKRVTLTVAEPSACQKRTGKTVTPRMICTMASIKRGPCKGDDGGPAINFDDFTLAGITSWGFENCYKTASTYPAVFTRISPIRNFIKQNTGL